MSDRYQPGELFVYVNGDRWELGMVKRPNSDGSGYFCWYSRGDTAANTPTEHMHKLDNAGFSHIEKDETTTCVTVSDGIVGHCECTSCGGVIDQWDIHCKHCGKKVVRQ